MLIGTLRWIARAAGVALLAATAAHAQAPAERSPADIRVLTIASPAQAGTEWRYAVSVVPGARLLGAPAGAALPARDLLFSVQLSASLAAGAQDVGVVRFTNGRDIVERPLRIAVAARRRVEVTVARALRAAQGGEVLRLPFTVANRGNAPDTLTLSLDAPSGWQAGLTTETSLVLAPGAAVSVIARVRPPITLSAGSGIVSLKANGRTAAHDAGVLVEVGASQVQSHHGPELTVGAASIGADASTMRTAYSLALRGDVTDALRIDAMVATQLNDDPLALRSVALLGAPVGGSRVRISGAHGAIEAGRVALRLPELGGLNMGGDGVALDWHVPDGSTLAVATARQAGAFGPGGTQAALQWSSRPAPLTLRLGASRLDERQTTGRRLDAVTADLRYAPSRRSAVSVELAERQFDNGRGVGAAGEASWDRDASRGRVRVFHAPGGAAAFAMARNGAMLETHGRLGARWQAAAQAWMMGDEGFDGSALRTSGGAFSPSVRVGTRADVGLSASYVRYASGAGAAHRHDAQQELMARGGMDLGVVRWDAEAGTERSVRGSSADGQRLSEVTARSVARSSLAVPTEHGTLSVRGSFRTASTFLASEGLIDLQLAGVRPIPGFHALTIDGGVQRVYLNRTGLSSVHAVVGLALPGGLRVLAGAQRDALMAVGGMGGGMVYSLRVERSSLAPGFAHFAQRSGVVYLDLNDNGVLDHGEPGLPGIIVRAGSVRGTTDRSGHYELSADAGAPSVDVRTLEDGMRLGAPAKAGSRDIPVRATSRLDVVVRREESFGRQATVLASIIVSARDAAGKEWVVVADASGRAHFDALPSGTYLVSAASDNENAPLRIEPVTVRIVAGAGKAPHVELVSRARPIRFQGGTLNSSSTINSTQQQSIGGSGNGQGVKQ